MSVTVVTMDGHATVTTGPAPVPSSPPRVACPFPALEGWAIDPDGGPCHLFAHRRGDGWASISIDVFQPGDEEGTPNFIAITGLPYLHRDSSGWYFYADDRPRSYAAIRLTDEAACGLVAHALRRLGVA